MNIASVFLVIPLEFFSYVVGYDIECSKSRNEADYRCEINEIDELSVISDKFLNKNRSNNKKSSHSRS